MGFSGTGRELKFELRGRRRWENETSYGLDENETVFGLYQEGQAWFGNCHKVIKANQSHPLILEAHQQESHGQISQRRLQDSEARGERFLPRPENPAPRGREASGKAKRIPKESLLRWAWRLRQVQVVCRGETEASYLHETEISWDPCWRGGTFARRAERRGLKSGKNRGRGRSWRTGCRTGRRARRGTRPWRRRCKHWRHPWRLRGSPSRRGTRIARQAETKGKSLRRLHRPYPERGP